MTAKTERSMGNQVISGAIVVAAVTWFVRLGALATHIFLARLLNVEQYGEAVIVFILIGLQQFIPNLGYSSALIQREEPPSMREINAAWTVDNLLTRLTFAAAIYFCAPILASFFGIVELVSLVAGCALVSVLAAFENSASMILFRRMKYRRHSLLVLSRGVAATIITIALVFYLRSPWAVVWGAIAGQALRTIVSYLVVSHVPRLTLDINFLRIHMGFSGWIVAVSFATKLRAYLDKILVARLLGPEGVAVFQLATRFSVETIRDVVHGSKQTLFPAISRIQNDKKRVSHGVMLSLQMVSLAGVCLSGAIAVLAEDLVLVFLGAKWEYIVPSVRLACVATWFIVITSIVAPLLRGAGSPKLEFQLQAFSAGALLAGIAPFALLFGVKGAILGLCMAELSAITYAFILLRRALEISIKSAVFQVLKPVLWGGVPLLACAILIPNISLGAQPLIRLILEGLLLLTMFLVTGFIAWRLRVLDSVNLFIEFLRLHFSKRVKIVNYKPKSALQVED